MPLEEYFDMSKSEIETYVSKGKETIAYLKTLGIKRDWLTRDEFNLVRKNIDNLGVDSLSRSSALWNLFLPTSNFDFQHYSRNAKYSDLIAYISLLVKDDKKFASTLTKNQILANAFEIRFARKEINEDIYIHANILSHIVRLTGPLTDTRNLERLRDAA